MSAQIAGFRPGDKVPVTYIRNGKEYNVNVTLTKKATAVTTNVAARLGGDLATLDASKASRYGLNGGVVVNTIKSGGILSNSKVQPGFIITGVLTSSGEVEISNLEDLNEALRNRSGTVSIIGVYPGYGESYKYPLNLGR